jgi:hypothetical protein
MASHKIPASEIDAIIEASDLDVRTVFGKCTVVSMRLPNGYVLVESSGCVSQEDYDEAYGAEQCMGPLRRKVWQLYGFAQQEKYPSLGNEG